MRGGLPESRWHTIQCVARMPGDRPGECTCPQPVISQREVSEFGRAERQFPDYELRRIPGWTSAVRYQAVRKPGRTCHPHTVITPSLAELMEVLAGGQ